MTEKCSALYTEIFIIYSVNVADKYWRSASMAKLKANVFINVMQCNTIMKWQWLELKGGGYAEETMQWLTMPLIVMSINVSHYYNQWRKYK
jgi:hypothetical protein